MLSKLKEALPQLFDNFQIDEIERFKAVMIFESKEKGGDCLMMSDFEAKALLESFLEMTTFNKETETFEWKEGYQMESFVCPTIETLFITSSEEDVNFTIQEFTNGIIGKNNSSS